VFETFRPDIQTGFGAMQEKTCLRACILLIQCMLQEWR